MSLVGNLEDLGLGDILQIVSLSKKSGVLSLSSGKREGLIFFLDGQVVRAVSSQIKASLGEILLKHKLIEPQALERALAEQDRNSHRALGPLLVEKFGVSQEKIEAVIKAQIEKVVYSFFAWKEGTFAFQLDEPEAIGPARLDPLDFMLEQGLSPQWLALEGRRLVAEGRLLSTEKDDDQEKSGDGQAVPVTVVTAEKSKKTATGPLFLIDDDNLTREVLERAFTRSGFSVETFALATELVSACSARVRKGERPVLLIDMIMPRLDGHGILGGLEVMEIVAEEFPDLPMLLMTDHPNAEAEKKAKELGGVAVLRKPRKMEVRERKGGEVLRALLGEVARFLPEPVGGRVELADPYQREAMPTAVALDAVEHSIDSLPEGSPGLYLLKGMLQELANPLLGGGVILLTLRFASEMMNRAVIFHVDGNTIVGLGQFGLDTTTENADRMVRRLRLQVAADSLFAQVLTTRRAAKGSLSQSESDRKLQAQLGGEEPVEVFIGPLVSEGKVVAVIYGDNLPEKKAIGNVETFEVFLSQAGMAMEKLLKERQG